MNIGTFGKAVVATIITLVMLAFVGFMAPAFANVFNNPNPPFADLASAVMILLLPFVAIVAAWVLVFKQPSPNQKAVSNIAVAVIFVVILFVFWEFAQRALS